MTGRLAKDIKQTKPFFSTPLEVYFNLLRTTDVLSRAGSGLLKAHDLSGTQYNVLRILRGSAQGDDGDSRGGLPCSEIGARLITHDPDVTRLLDRLEKRGLVERARGDSDRRVVMVRITPAGSALVESCDLDRRMTEAFAPHFAALSAGDCQTLITLLENLRHP
jgi:MarR family transcriptional regulator, organic hydroperoxide resistance regulator